MIPISAELLADDGMGSVHAYIWRGVHAALDRQMRPWAYPDPAPTWTFEPFPRIARFAAWLRGKR